MQENIQPPVVADPQLLSVNNQDVNQPIVKKVQKGEQMKKVPIAVVLVVGFFTIMVGAATGWGSYGVFSETPEPETTTVTQITSESSIKNGSVFGSNDTETFPDIAEGFLESGGINGEGSHKLLREGGPSQTVYLTSSVTDLEKLVGMQVKVWGETFKGQKAGWLMDVGRVEILDVEGVSPETLE